MKICCICKIVKSLEDFCKCKNSKDGLNYSCKECNKKVYENKKHIYKLQKKQHYLNNKAAILKKKKEYADQHKQEKREYDLKYRKNNQIRIQEHKRKWAQKHKNSIMYKMKRNLRRRLHHALKGENKSKHTIELLGCQIDFLVIYLEQQFTNEMNWENYGSYWHVDHIIPCYKFDLTKPEEQAKCFHYTNLRPLPAKENISYWRRQ